MKNLVIMAAIAGGCYLLFGKSGTASAVPTGGVITPSESLPSSVYDATSGGGQIPDEPLPKIRVF